MLTVKKLLSIDEDVVETFSVISEASGKSPTKLMLSVLNEWAFNKRMESAKVNDLILKRKALREEIKAAGVHEGAGV